MHLPQYREGKIHYDGTAEIMSVYMAREGSKDNWLLWNNANSFSYYETSFGKPKILEKPSIEKVVEKLGSLSSDFDGTEDSNDQPKRKSKRKHKAN